MKKLLTFFMALGLVAFVATSAQAQEKYVAGGFEAAGHIVTGAGYQHQFKNTVGAGTANSEGASVHGVLGRYLAAVPAGYSDQVMFFVDEVELDLMKSFGENIRLRADLDFGRAASGSGNAIGLRMEQAYATANIPVGNGIEFLLGRFNAPAGFEAVDVTDNDLISQTFLIRAGLRPVDLTGLKLYYAFTDLVDLHFYITNNLTADTLKTPNDVPSLGFRLGFNWGDEGTESTFGFTGFAGPESGNNKQFSFGGDLDLNWWLTESFALGAEALFRRDQAVAGASKQETMAGLVNLHYAFSDVWDGTLRYAFTKQFDPTNGALVLTGYEGANHEISIGGGYAVADGAKIKLEGRFDILNPTGASNTAYDFGGALAFDYSF